MKRMLIFVVVLVFVTLAAGAQVEKIIITAGSPEDKAGQAASAETDPQKRLALWQDFLKQFSSNPKAVAYGNSQISQLYLDQGDTAKALECEDKALAAQPHNLELLVAAAAAAQRAKDNGRIVDYAARGGEAFNGIAHQTRPEGMADDAFELKIKQDQEPFLQSYQYLEAAGLNAITSEDDAKKRMGYIERFMAAFPNSLLQEQIMQMAVYTLAQTKDADRLKQFADKALAADPNGMSTLVVLATAFSEYPDAAFVTRGMGYAQKALNLPKAQTKLEDSQYTFYSGLAHSALGYGLMTQDKTLPSITELKTATTQLKGHPDAYSAALFRLGYAYAKIGKLAEAKAALTEVAGTQGPYQESARDLLNKVTAAAAKGRAK